MKNLALGFGIFCISICSVNANTRVDVYAPCFAGGYSVGLAGIYIRPSLPALDYAVYIPDFTDPGFQRIARSLNPDYDWGWQAQARYFLRSTGNDVLLSLSTFSRNTHDDLVNLPDGTQIIGTLTADFDATQFAIPGVTSDVRVHARAKFEYQTVDLNIGQHLNVGCRTTLRFNAGLRYVNLEHKLDADYFHALTIFGLPTDVESFLTSQHSDFRGIGPRIGLTGGYQLGCGFFVVGETATALLVGDADNHYSQIATFFDDTTVTSHYDFPDDGRVVANLTARLALAYARPINQCLQYKIEAGYLVEHYYNTVYRLSATSLELEGRTNRLFDTSFDGPYLSLEIKI